MHAQHVSVESASKADRSGHALCSYIHMIQQEGALATRPHECVTCQLVQQELAGWAPSAARTTTRVCTRIPQQSPPPPRTHARARTGRGGGQGHSIRTMREDAETPLMLGSCFTYGQVATASAHFWGADGLPFGLACFFVLGHPTDAKSTTAVSLMPTHM